MHVVCQQHACSPEGPTCKDVVSRHQHLKQGTICPVKPVEVPFFPLPPPLFPLLTAGDDFLTAHGQGVVPLLLAAARVEGWTTCTLSPNHNLLHRELGSGLASHLACGPCSRDFHPPCVLGNTGNEPKEADGQGQLSSRLLDHCCRDLAVMATQLGLRLGCRDLGLVGLGAPLRPAHALAGGLGSGLGCGLGDGLSLLGIAVCDQPATKTPHRPALGLGHPQAVRQATLPATDQLCNRFRVDAGLDGRAVVRSDQRGRAGCCQQADTNGENDDDARQAGHEGQNRGHVSLTGGLTPKEAGKGAGVGCVRACEGPDSGQKPCQRQDCSCDSEVREDLGQSDSQAASVDGLHAEALTLLRGMCGNVSAPRWLFGFKSAEAGHAPRHAAAPRDAADWLIPCEERATRVAVRKAVEQALPEADLCPRGPGRDFFAEVPDVCSTLYSVELHVLHREGLASGSAPPEEVGTAFHSNLCQVFWDCHLSLLLVQHGNRVVPPVRGAVGAMSSRPDLALPVEGAAFAVVSRDDLAHSGRNGFSGGRTGHEGPSQGENAQSSLHESHDALLTPDRGYWFHDYAVCGYFRNSSGTRSALLGVPVEKDGVCPLALTKLAPPSVANKGQAMPTSIAFGPEAFRVGAVN